MRDRILLRASRQGQVYRELLEFRARKVRLLVPAPTSRRRAWSLGVLLTFGIVGIVTLLSGGVRTAGLPAMSAEGWSFLLLTAAYGAGIVLVVFWWDRHNPFVLAEDLSEGMDLDVLGSQSFGAFHEVRARPGGRTTTLAVHATRRQIQDAFRLAGLPAPAG